MSRLALAYGRHQVRRRFRRPSTQAHSFLDQYAPDRLQPLSAAERENLGAMSRCINCGLCALAARRSGGVSAPDLASAYLRPYHLLPLVRRDVSSGIPDLRAAADACPVAVPLPQVAQMVMRLSVAS